MIPEDLHRQLARHGITSIDEVVLREALEARIGTYTLIKLASWPARRWKCQYRLLIGDKIYDAQSAAEAYATGLLAILENSST
jgi:hypothetical protein